MRSVALSSLLLLVACSGGSGEPVDAASERGVAGGPCYPNDTCNEGLVCENDRCSPLPEGEEGGPCYPNDTCNVELVCVEGTCLRLIADAGIVDAGGADDGSIPIEDAAPPVPDASVPPTPDAAPPLPDAAPNVADAGQPCVTSDTCGNGECCLSLGGPGFCVPGEEVLGVCLPD